MLFQKGQSGNPKGRPRAGEALGDKYADVAKRIHPVSKLTYYETLVLTTFDLAINEKNVAAIKEINDRLLGKPKETLEVRGYIEQRTLETEEARKAYRTLFHEYSRFGENGSGGNGVLRNE